MSDLTPTTRFTLRQLPLPAKLVISTFLLSVGLGYTSAMIQLHMQHSDRDGSHLPSPANVVAVFAGKVWKMPTDSAPVTRLESLLLGSPEGGLTGQNMAPAMFGQDNADYRKLLKDPVKGPRIKDEREGERQALIAWARAPSEVRRKLTKKIVSSYPTPGHPNRSRPASPIQILKPQQPRKFARF